MLAPSRIGRFVVLRELGAGAMGVVYAAYDAKLDRRVAIKVLRDNYPGAHELGTSRLEREAQALARLSHPNVVQVYEVGPVEGGIFIAMELVHGRTLREWLRETPRDWRAVLTVFLQVGAGLQAAHASGVIHRDIKPDNILVGEDGRPRILDFSLAAPIDRQAELDALGNMRASNVLITQDGGFVGTPAYMSPEQFLGTPTDARSDQFSYCTTLWEALYGERPFPGATVEQIRGALLRGRAAAPAHDRVPTAIRRAVERGLQIDPGARHADFAALLAALSRDPHRTHKWVAGLTALVVTIGAGSALVQPAAIDCRAAAAAVGEVYNPGRHDALLLSFARSPLPYARASARALVDELAGYAARWARTAEQACVATHIRHEASSELLDRRGACLRERLGELEALLAVLADPAAAERALQAVRELPAPERCLQPRESEVRVTAREAAPLQARLAAVSAQLAAGDDARALALAQSVMSEQTGLLDPVLKDEAHYWRGRAALASLQLERAEADLHPAFHGAIRRGDDELGFRAAIALAEVASRRAQFAIAEEWLDHAEDALQRGQLGEGPLAQLELRRGEALSDAGRPAEALVALGRASTTLQRALGPDAFELARVHLLRGIALRDLGRVDEALQAFARDEEILRAAFGESHPSMVVPLNNRGAALLDLGRADEALELFRRGLAIRLRAYGRDHPRTAFSLSQVGEALTDLHCHAEAEAALREALAIRLRILGPDHPDVAETLTGLGNLATEQRHHAEARRLLTEVLRIRQAAYGDDHDIVASAHRNLADAAREAGDLVTAERELGRAEAIWSAHLPADHPKVATLQLDRGQLAEARGQLEAAANHYTRALELTQQRLGAEDPKLAPILRALGHVQLARGERAAAAAALGRATTLPPAPRPLAPERVARAHFDMARALWPESPIRARGEAAVAAEALRDSPGEAELLRAIEAWRATHRE
ncbi:serine/threonine-protein kinase [Nannocystis bainbridge]|uniref:Serine/threonine-protein kinase n=1 Tax=Nannocystis bainbridge TaxID=2995303 RepID=A0ABT5E8W2_9BACT|nr:serine/threonine-protein kinase [Nannocystis bainbridge]MDC0722299.1 serine/threonine-protein kinase [Nannocystis bainbridge]